LGGEPEPERLLEPDAIAVRLRGEEIFDLVEPFLVERVDIGLSRLIPGAVHEIDVDPESVVPISASHAREVCAGRYEQQHIE
jgi:hypothetical protein